MNLMNVVRIAKVIALLAFVLPWVAISCSVPGQGSIDLATASGIELIQGKMTANPDAEKQMSRGMGLPQDPSGRSPGMAANAPPELGMNFFGVAAAAVIVIGLVLSLLGKGASSARNVLITSLLGAALSFGTVWYWKDQMKREGLKDEPANASSPLGGASDNPFGAGGGNPFGGGMTGMGADMLDSMLQERFGYWICLSALIVAAGAAGLGMAGGAAGAAKPGATPPPAG
jgi:hypothetical protein